jgi:hypothetical protein
MGKYLTLSKPVRGRVLGLKHNDWTWLTMNVVPMGWLSAVGVIQYLHRQLALRVAGLPRQLELRRDRPPALNEKFEIRRFWQLYIDNFDEGFPKTKNHREGSRPSEWAAALKKAGGSVGIAYSEDEKRVQDQLEAATLGGSIAGRRGLIMATDKRLSLLVGITFAMMSQPHTRLKDVEVVAGNWIHNIQFNRATMAALDNVWEAIQGKVDAAKRSSLV